MLALVARSTCEYISQGQYSFQTYDNTATNNHTRQIERHEVIKIIQKVHLVDRIIVIPTTIISLSLMESKSQMVKFTQNYKRPQKFDSGN